MRANNLFFGDDGLVAIDSQALACGRGAFDACYLGCQSIASTEPRASETDPLVAYHRAPVGLGIADHDTDAFLQDVGAAILTGIAQVILGNGSAREFGPAMLRFLDVIPGRALDAADDYAAAPRLAREGDLVALWVDKGASDALYIPAALRWVRAPHGMSVDPSGR